MSSAEANATPVAKPYRERAVRFGAHGGLVGVLTEPVGEPAQPDAPVVIMSNVGINHHVGPYRLWVDLARELAAVGFASLRFDTAGLGDSEARREAVSDIERAVLDFDDAIKLLTERIGAKTFVPMALCSGVDAAHRVACRNPNIAGAVFLDGYAYRTAGFRLRWWTARWFQWRRWRRFFRRRWIHRVAAKGVRETGEVDEIFVRDYPPLEQLAKDFDGMVARGMRLFFAFTGEVDHSYNGKEQLFEMFPSLKASPAVTSEYHQRADHVYSFTRDRRMLIDQLRAWMATCFRKPGA